MTPVDQLNRETSTNAGVEARLERIEALLVDIRDLLEELAEKV